MKKSSFLVEIISLSLFSSVSSSSSDRMIDFQFGKHQLEQHLR